MKFRRRVRNRRIIKAVVATLMAFLVVLTSGHAPVKHSHAQSHNKTKISHNVNHKTQSATTLKGRTQYHANGNVYMQQGKRLQVGATAYTNDPITSTGTKPTEGRTIAVDPRIIPYGTKVYIPQFDRVFIAEDCGSAIKGNRIDIYMDDYDRCIDWGFKTIDIYILNNNN